MLAVLGSQRARQLQISTYHQDQYVNYTKQLDSLTAQFTAMPASQWVDNLYWNWLYTLAGLLQPCGQGYPFFMTNQAWIDKSLTTALGSWAQLRHSTILYAKQSYAMTTGIPSSCENLNSYPQGYVEPNPDVFGRLAAMVSFMQSGFNGAGLSQMLPVNKLTELSGLCGKLRDIAAEELQGTDITIGQYSDIANAYIVLMDIEDFSQYQIPPPSVSNPPGADSSTASIVDVHTDPNSGQVLEEGVGKPECLYVIAPVEGKLQICRGAIFSYYEFLHPMSDRMTDAEWQVMLGNSKPAVPVWESELITGTDQSTYKNTKEENLLLVSPHDSIPKSFHAGDSIAAFIWSATAPTVTIESRGISQVFRGSPGDSALYRIIIPSESLADTNILTIGSQLNFPGSTNPMDPCAPSQVSVSHRQVLIRDYKEVLAAARRLTLAAVQPRFHHNRLFLPSGTAWRIIDTRGRQMAFISSGSQQWVLPARLAHMQLFLIPMNEQMQRPMRFIVGD